MMLWLLRCHAHLYTISQIVAAVNGNSYMHTLRSIVVDTHNTQGDRHTQSQRLWMLELELYWFCHCETDAAAAVAVCECTFFFSSPFFSCPTNTSIWAHHSMRSTFGISRAKRAVMCNLLWDDRRARFIAFAQFSSVQSCFFLILFRVLKPRRLVSHWLALYLYIRCVCLCFYEHMALPFKILLLKIMIIKMERAKKRTSTFVLMFFCRCCTSFQPTFAIARMGVEHDQNNKHAFKVTPIKENGWVCVRVWYWVIVS